MTDIELDECLLGIGFDLCNKKQGISYYVANIDEVYIQIFASEIDEFCVEVFTSDKKPLDKQKRNSYSLANRCDYGNIQPEGMKVQLGSFVRKIHELEELQ